MRRWRLSKRDKKRLVARLQESYPGLIIDREVVVDVVVDDDARMYLFNGEPAFIEVESGEGTLLIPHLLYLLRHGRGWLPAIVVDEGAVRPISRGADLMRPGIVRVEGVFRAGDIVVVVEPSRGLPLAVHRALYSSEEVLGMERGRVAVSLHHVGDRYWELAKNL